LGPQSPMYFLKMGELRLAQKRTADAEAMFRQALTRDPNSFEAIRGIVQVDEAKSKPADAMAFVQEQIKRNPNNPGLFMLLAELQVQAKQLKQAEDSASQVLALDKNNIPAMVLLAQLQSADGSTDKAIALYQRAIELSPRDVRLQIALGALYERAGNWQQAESTYQKVLAIDAENPLASNNLAYLLLEHGGSPNVALTLAQAARRGLPNLPNSADTLGRRLRIIRPIAITSALPTRSSMTLLAPKPNSKRSSV
jgi:tetratricopeptide (TPR) repeat protein